METTLGTALAMIDGRQMPLAEASLAVTDDGVARGDGAFETVGVWDGRPFRLPDHLERLHASLLAVGLPGVDGDRLTAEAQVLLDRLGQRDAALRVYVTASGTRVLTLTDQPVRAPVRRLIPQPAPWIRPRGTYAPAGAKTMSYGPNMAATRAARRAGGDDALLCSLDGDVLEGPTFCVLWAAGGRLRTPSPELGIVDSISRRTLLELAADAGIDAVEGRFGLADLIAAEEAMACSSVREVTALTAVGDHVFAGPTPVSDRLRAALSARRRDRPAG